MQGVHQWVRKWAAIQGDELAVTCDGVSVTWSQLDRRVDSLAQHMVSLGIKRGDRVGCMMNNSVEFVDTLHAASRIGAIFVPINIRYTSHELNFAGSHAGLSLLAVDDSFADVVAGADLDAAVLWRADWPIDGPALTESVETSWQDDGFLLFTSGSTGTPRAVLHAQDAFLWASMDSVLIHHYGTSDTMVTPLPLCFTGGMAVVTALAHSGGHLVLMSSFSSASALDLIESHRATLFHGVPIMCQHLVNDPRWATADLTSMRLARTGAAPVASGLMQAWTERGVPLTQGYGSTETAGSGFTLPAADAHRYGKCGRPSFYADVRIVNPASGESMPVGEVGEVLFRGPQLMRAYWNEPEATAATVRDGWLWTGDLAFVDEDGFYEIAGRSKDLIITGGLNVYPAEVELALQQAPAVADASVVGLSSERWGEEVVAVIAPADGSFDLAVVQDYCRTVLADYKCPKVYVVSERPLQRTASGKIVKSDVVRLVADFAAANASGAAVRPV